MRNYLLTSPKTQSFTQFWGHLAPTFVKRGKIDIKAHVTTAAISGESSPGAHRESMSCNSQKCQNKIDIQAAEITNMWSELKRAKDENEKLRQAFDPSSIAQVTNKAVNSLQTKPDRSSSGVARSLPYEAKPCNGKPRPFQLSPGADGTFDWDSTCLYCKDMGHRKDICIWLNCKLACKLQMIKVIVG